jgi:hypothetical protein
MFLFAQFTTTTVYSTLAVLLLLFGRWRYHLGYDRFRSALLTRSPCNLGTLFAVDSHVSIGHRQGTRGGSGVVSVPAP